MRCTPAGSSTGDSEQVVITSIRAPPSKRRNRDRKPFVAFSYGVPLRPRGAQHKMRRSHRGRVPTTQRARCVDRERASSRLAARPLRYCLRHLQGRRVVPGAQRLDQRMLVRVRLVLAELRLANESQDLDPDAHDGTHQGIDVVIRRVTHVPGLRQQLLVLRRQFLEQHAQPNGIIDCADTASHVNDLVIPCRHHAARFCLGRIPARGDVVLRTLEDDQARSPSPALRHSGLARATWPSNTPCGAGSLRNVSGT